MAERIIVSLLPSVCILEHIHAHTHIYIIIHNLPAPTPTQSYQHDLEIHPVIKVYAPVDAPSMSSRAGQKLSVKVGERV